MESRSDGESAARDEPPSNMAAGSGASEFIACQFYACWSGNGRNHLGGANIAGGQWAVGFGSEFRTEPEIGQTPPWPGWRLTWMAFAQPGEREFARGAVGAQHYRHLARGRSAAQQFDEHPLSLGMCVFS